MRSSFAVMLLVLLALVLETSSVSPIIGCTPATRRDVADALDESIAPRALACALASAITNAEELARVCHLLEKGIPFLRDLIATREAARRSGVVWREDADGGVVAYARIDPDAGSAPGARDASVDAR